MEIGSAKALNVRSYGSISVGMMKKTMAGYGIGNLYMLSRNTQVLRGAMSLKREVSEAEGHY